MAAQFLHEIVDDNYVVIDYSWTVRQAREIVQNVRTSHVIVHRLRRWYNPDHSEEYYYLYTYAEAMNMLRRADDRARIEDAFNLHESGSTPTRDSFDTIEAAPPRSIIVDDGHLVGFRDLGAATETRREDPTPPPITRSPIRRNGGGTSTALPGDPPTASPPPIRRNGEPTPTPAARSIMANFPQRAQVGETVSLRVSLMTEVNTESAGGSRTNLTEEVPVGGKVDIVVLVESGFELLDGDEQHIEVGDDPDLMSVQFKLKTKDVGVGKLRVLGYYKGQSIASIRLAATILAASGADVGADEPTSSQSRRDYMGEVSAIRVTQPDLSLLILEDHSSTTPTITIRVSSPKPELNLNFMPYGPITFKVNLDVYFQNLFADIDGLSLETAADRAKAEFELASKGAELFKIFPPELQTLIWNLQKEIQSVQVMSKDPWIP